MWMNDRFKKRQVSLEELILNPIIRKQINKTKDESKSIS